MDASRKIVDVLGGDGCRKCVKTLLGDSDFEILDYKLEPMGAVTGFLGIHLNLAVTLLHQKKKKYLDLFLKSLPLQESQRKFTEEMGVFGKEVEFYEKIVADLKRHAPSIQLPITDCYLKQPGLLVMENLIASGYVVPDGKEPFCFEDCSAILEHLGRLHASSVVLAKKLGRPLDQVYDLSERQFVRKEGYPAYDWIESGYRCFKALAMEVPKYKMVLEKDEQCVLKTWNSVWDIVKTSSKYLNVICHGDLWFTNMLVHRNKNGQTDSVKFVDFQVTRYCPAAIDIATFLHISTSRQVRDQHLQELLKVYFDAFTQAVSVAGVKLPEFTLDALKTSFEELRNLGYVCAVLYLPMILMDQKEIEGVVDVASANAFDDFVRLDRSVPALKAFKSDSKYTERVMNAMEELFMVSK